MWAREAHQVHLQLGQVDIDLAGGLGRIDVEDDALLAADLADLGDRLDHADFVVHEHHRDQDGVGPDRGLQGVQVDQAVFLHVEVGGLEALALQLAHGVEHGLVLGLDGDEVLALAVVEMRSALDRQVVGLGRAGGPDDLLGSASTSAATRSRAFSTAFSAAQPKAWLREAGLPNCSVR